VKTILVILTSLFLFTSCGSSVPDTVVIPVKTEKMILALGDSLTAGYGLPADQSYPAQLEAILREK
jgi:acyl-CoA thioesterase I